MTQSNYIPERLFFHNLFSCCCCTPSELHEAINNQIVRDLDKEMSCLETIIKKRANNKETTILPNSFIKEANKLQTCSPKLSSNNRKGRYKLPDYCLIKYYNIIKHTNLIIENENGVSHSVPSRQENDLGIFKNFSECIQLLICQFDAGAVSEKNLERLLTPCGSPYTKNQSGLIRYTLNYVFPKFTSYNGNSFFETIKIKNWKDIIYKDVQTNEPKVYLDESAESFSEIEAFFEERFNKLIQTPDKDADVIGGILVELYEKLVDFHKDDLLSSQQNLIFCESEVKIELLDEITPMSEYDSVLSTHILDFMRWLPMIPPPPYPPQLLQCIESVIDKIRNYIMDNHDVKKQMLSTCQENLFTLNSNVDLRKELISALHDDVYIHSYFHDHYEFACNTKENNL